MKVAEIQVSYSTGDNDKIKITRSDDIYKLLVSHWNMETIEMQEVVKIVLLNRANYVLGIYELSKGGISNSTVDIKLLLSVALKSLASSIVLAHNHPSGNLKPSKSDFLITKKLKDACNILGIVLIDHIIVTKQSFYSFADNTNL